MVFLNEYQLFQTFFQESVALQNKMKNKKWQNKNKNQKLSRSTKLKNHDIQ
jgi:hypothetical protein